VSLYFSVSLFVCHSICLILSVPLVWHPVGSISFSILQGFVGRLWSASLCFNFV
jgi:hypothetical protein